MILMLSSRCVLSPVKIYRKWWLLIMTINRASNLDFRSTLPGCLVLQELRATTLALTNS